MDESNEVSCVVFYSEPHYNTPVHPNMHIFHVQQRDEPFFKSKWRILPLFLSNWNIKHLYRVLLALTLLYFAKRRPYLALKTYKMFPPYFQKKIYRLELGSKTVIKMPPFFTIKVIGHFIIFQNWSR